MGKSGVTLFLLLSCTGLLLIHCAHGQDPREQANQCSANNVQAPGFNAIFNTLVSNIVHDFGDQAADGHHQFAVLMLLPHNATTNMPYIPSTHGRPIVDNTVPLSPAFLRDRVNYVVARPHTNHRTGVITHAEVLVLREMWTLMQNYRCHYGENPSFVILYTWIVPCQSCFQVIMQNLEEYHIPSYVMYSTLGVGGSRLSQPELVDLNEQIQFYDEFALGLGIRFRRVPCYSHPRNQQRLIKRAAGEETCAAPGAVETVQMCLFEWLKSSAGLSTSACNVSTEYQEHAIAEVVNQLMKACGSTSDNFTPDCGLRFLNSEGVLGGACQRIYSYQSNVFSKSVSFILNQCLHNNIELVISNPLQPGNPSQFTGILRTPASLSIYNEFTIPCLDQRREGLFCSKWKREYLTAGNGVCSKTSPCHSYNNNAYKYCYLQIGSWNYCCDEDARCENGICRSGQKSVACLADISWDPQSSNRCMPYTPCGFHNSGKTAKWCWIDNGGNWEHC